MRSDSTRDAILRTQRTWAVRQGLNPDSAGYLPNYGANLRGALTEPAFIAFSNGRGSELVDLPNRPAKMRALHSSSALVVNVFDYWTERIGRFPMRAFGIDGDALAAAFEMPLSTGAGGTPPHLDLVLQLRGEMFVGVESKFTEWLSPKLNMRSSLGPYRDGDKSYWSQAGLTRCHTLVEAIVHGAEQFRYLDVPQLLKHALGLAKAYGARWMLRYLYFDADGGERALHTQEISRFQAAVGDELRFRAMTYQELAARLAQACSGDDAEYMAYLRERYSLQ